MLAWELAGDSHYKSIAAKKSEYERRDKLEMQLRACAGAAECVERAIEQHYEKATAQYDLQAQERMANYALLLTVVSVFQLGVSGLGIVYVAKNLKQTSESIQIANKAIAVENRPWVNITHLSTKQRLQARSRESVGIYQRLNSAGGV